MKKDLSLSDLKEVDQAPIWMTQEGFKTLSGGYLLMGETPRKMYERVARRVAEKLTGDLNEQNALFDKFFDVMWKGWLCPASPVLSNTGTERGLPISCFSCEIPDSVDGIMSSMHEVAMLSKNGGGVGTHWSKVRPRGSAISGNGKSDGVIPFIKILDSTIVGISQGGVRRGAASAYLDIEHSDFSEFINMRRPVGDPNRQCLNLHHSVCVSDSFMKKLEDGDSEARSKWKEVLKSRLETGEPYFFFTDNVNNQNPDCYKDKNFIVQGSNICNEIYLYTDSMHTFVCCLASLNLTLWDEWKNTDLVRTAIWFLDGVMQEFIDRAKNIPGFANSVRFAEKSRALGLGVLGFHTLLQKKKFAFDSLSAYNLNNLIFRKMRSEADAATKELAEIYGEPEWCKGHGRRNSHTLAVAPTVSNSTISGGHSSGIEPITANAFAQKSAKGTFLIKNPQLESLLQERGKNDDEVWKSIVVNEGSVQHLSFLSDEEKKIFETAREINQFTIVRLASARQKYIDQGQSVNLFFPVNVDPKYFHQVHVEAWKSGLKGLYYCRSSSVLKGDAGSKEYKRELSECNFCEG